MLKPIDDKNYVISVEISEEDLAMLRLALHDLSMDVLCGDGPSDYGRDAVHRILFFFRPCWEDEITTIARKAS